MIWDGFFWPHWPETDPWRLPSGPIWIEFKFGDVYYGYLGVEDGKFTIAGSGKARVVLNALAERAATSPSPEFLVELVRGLHRGVRVEQTGPRHFLVHVLAQEGESA